MASINLIKASDGTGNASTATVQTVRNSGVTTIIVDTVNNISATFMGSMGTPHTFVDPVTAEEITVISEATAVDFTGHVSGVNLEIDSIAPGYTDLGSAVGDIIVIRPTTDWANNIATVLAAEHNQDGTHLFSGAWTAWTPTWTNVSGGTLNYASYKQIGKTVFWRIKYTLGGAGVIGGIIFSAPVTISSGYANGDTVAGSASFVDASEPGRYLGTVNRPSTTTIELRAIDAAGAYAKISIVQTTVPFTWATGDTITAHGHYEAA